MISRDESMHWTALSDFWCAVVPVTPSAVGAIGLQAVPLATATRNPAAGAGAAAVPVPVPVPVVVVGHMVGVLFVSEVVCWFATRLKARGQRWVWGK